jgi:hypothetical protein
MLRDLRMSASYPFVSDATKVRKLADPTNLENFLRGRTHQNFLQESFCENFRGESLPQEINDSHAPSYPDRSLVRRVGAMRNLSFFAVDVVGLLPHRRNSMSFLSITTWRMISEAETLEHVTELMRKKYFPGLKSLGAENSMVADIGLDRFAIVTVYPSREVRDAALESITQLRSEGAEEFGAEIMDAHAGDVLARLT